ncbi:MAG: phosphomethylpyrimidine synthase ThiC, partial [Methanothrix sp.]|nr:phosphomethylpyrimidine synthase ThiC [Methanothrix sp.]
MDKNLLTAAIAGEEVPVIDEVAKTEGVKSDFLRRQIASGRVAVMQRDGEPPLGIGEGLKTKINANIGTSAAVFDPDIEVEKARIAEKYGADTISDLSMGGNIDEIRQRILDETTAPLTTVPIYQTVVEAGSFKAITEQDLIRMIKKHVSMGISSIVVHAGFTHKMLEKLRNTKRIMGMVSKGGSFTSAWMLQSGKDNPFWSHFDEICEAL